MFKIPEWGEDVPKSNTILNKLGKNKHKELSASSTSTHLQPVKKAAKIIKKEKPKTSTALGNPSTKHNLKSKRKVLKPHNKAKIVRSTENEKSPNKTVSEIFKKNQKSLKKTVPETNNKKSPPKLWKKKPAENVELLDLNTDKLDEVLLNAKKRKFSEAFQKYESEDALFTAEQKSKKSKNSKPVQKKVSQTKQNIVSKINGQSVLKKTKVDDKFQNQKEIKKDKNKEKLKTILASIRTPILVKGNNLRERMLERLKAAQFRYLNEKLYTSSASDAQQLFQSDPMAFETYHQGYQQQVKKWPVKPLDVIVKKIVKMPKSHLIADMGCGEAALSKRVPHKVRSFDLVATAPGVEACDMAHTPLLSASVDVAVYCLALMGTDLTQYLCEANRVLKNGGHLLIAEVESRFEKVEDFIDQVQKLGFKLKNLDKSNTVFFFIEFTKVREPPAKKSKLPSLHLKPCLYKKR